MSRLIVQGGRSLCGELTVQGAKNSVLPILAATILCGELCILRNCPRLRDVETAIAILRHLGAQAWWEADALYVDSGGVQRGDIPEEWMHEMRSSVMFLGAILARLGQAVLYRPGGCELGPRPIDLHISALRLLGAEIVEQEETLHCRTGLLHGTEIRLRTPSVGATENILLAACGAQGETLVQNAAREPEIVDLQNFLNACGADISGAGGSVIRIRGGRALHGADYTVMSDRIVAATYLCAAASAGGEIALQGVQSSHFATVSTALQEAGCQVFSEKQRILLRRSRPLRAIGEVVTAPYPAFPTDGQAVLMAALLKSEGSTRICETMFCDRFRHVEQLRRMGAQITVEGCRACVHGVPSLRGAEMEATDLRGGAALCVAALAAEGESVIRQISHIERGYADLAGDLRQLGAEVRRVE